MSEQVSVERSLPSIRNATRLHTAVRAKSKEVEDVPIVITTKQAWLPSAGLVPHPAQTTDTALATNGKEKTTSYT